MKASGLVVEYNPFHNGHLYHVNQARLRTKADCIIAVMSGPFLQRGEPAIIDKFHRAKAALSSGIDMVLELPFPYAVQSSELFAYGAIRSLDKMAVSSICFGSESGEIKPFIDAFHLLQSNQVTFDNILQEKLQAGYSFPQASSAAYAGIGLDQLQLDQPNNILGFSYVREILLNNLDIEPVAIKRIQNAYHDTRMDSEIASATSIRKHILGQGETAQVSETLPTTSLQQLIKYQESTKTWHDWEDYFPFLHYKVMTSTPAQLAKFHGVDEGLEYRLKKTAPHANSFADWMNRLKTKRYTYTRLQRMCVHILTNTTKEEINTFMAQDKIPYIRLLGMNETGRKYLNQQKHSLDLPLITNLNQKTGQLTSLDERAQETYYSILKPEVRQDLQRQEFKLPIIL